MKVCFVITIVLITISIVWDIIASVMTITKGNKIQWRDFIRRMAINVLTIILCVYILFCSS